MAMPELLGASPFAPMPRPRLKTRFGGLCLVVAGLLLMEFTATSAVKAVGYADHQGTMTIGHCRITRQGSGHEGTSCDGVFRPSDGGAVLRDAEIDGSYVPGERLTVYREWGSYSLIGLRTFWEWLIFLFMALPLMAHGVMLVVAGFQPKTLGQFKAVREMLRRAMVAEHVRWLRRVGGVGMLACFLLACVSP
ncbi:hypothetical protein [Streptomyces sp. UNOB3_S3]|uniref:hypothetical protein n=1 Tax=Streptomyces sp. UNOB3_S3 TaxID=2871682 RepID=UPI001E367F5B|nr:hypothetical protein [Streptomyces sp. UNOB3_S3]MCC3776757.1 hypothetical protein [Streptomyces sp. UNOB3_S3]